MNYYDFCHDRTHFSVADYHNASDELQNKFKYYDQNTDRVIRNWDELSPKNERMLSLIYQYLQVFDNDEKIAVSQYKAAKDKANDVLDAYLDKHLFRKMDSKYPDTFPEGVSKEVFTEMVKQKSELLYNHVFHMEFVEKYFYWKLDNEIYVNFLDE